MNQLSVRLKKVKPGAIAPTYATPGSAACDLSACLDEPVTLHPGDIAAIPTGIALSSGRDDIVALVYGRSGLGTKHGVTLANSVGVIDSDYRGEIRVSLINRGREDFTVHPGDRIAQLMFAPVLHAVFEMVETLDETERGEGGFGSTGISAAKS